MKSRKEKRYAEKASIIIDLSRRWRIMEEAVVRGNIGILICAGKPTIYNY